MMLSLRQLVFVLAVTVVAATAAEPIVVKESDVVFPGFLGLGRKVESETLILPSASSVLDREQARERRDALREARDVAVREQERQSAARRQAESEAMASVAPAPGDAAGAEAAMVEASSQPVPETVTATAGAEETSVETEASPEPAEE